MGILNPPSLLPEQSCPPTWGTNSIRAFRRYGNPDIQILGTLKFKLGFLWYFVINIRKLILYLLFTLYTLWYRKIFFGGEETIIHIWAKSVFQPIEFLNPDQKYENYGEKYKWQLCYSLNILTFFKKVEWRANFSCFRVPKCPKWTYFH